MAGSGTVLSPILVGRDGHLELAESRLADAAAGHGRMLLIAGEAGIGKSRLLKAILRRAKGLGFTVAKGDIAPADRDVPGGLLLDLARTMRDSPPLAATGDELLALWRGVTERGASSSRTVVLEVVDRIRMATTSPLALAFEDVQWSDDLSLDVIAELARTSESRPLLLLAAYRRDETTEASPLRAWRSRLLTQRLAEEVRLDRLTPTETATMVTLLLDSGLPAPRDVAAAVHERSDGVPLHVEELIAAVRARGPVDAAAIRHVEVPDTIEDAVMARTSRLTPQAQAVARAGAVLGRCFVPEVLGGVMDVPVAELEGPLEELVEHAILFPFGARDEGFFDFRHQLLREAVYRHTPARERRRYHARAAEFGAALEGVTEVHASLHFARAGLRVEAYRAALAGARAAARMSAHREAFELYRRAFDNLPEDLDPMERAALLEAFGVEALAVEDRPTGEWSARSAAAAYRDAGEPRRAIGAMALVLVLWRRDGHPVAERIALATALLDELDGQPEDRATLELRGEVAFYHAYNLVDGYQLGAAREIARAGLAVADTLGSRELRLLLEEVLALVDFVDTSPEAGMARMATAAAAAEAERLETPILTGMRDGSILAVRAMKHGLARDLIGTGLRYATEFQQEHCGHVMAGMSAVLDWTAGSWDAASLTANQVMADRGCRRGAAAAQWASGYVAMGRGDLRTAAIELQAALDWGESSGALDLVLPAAWGLAETELLAGDAAAAAHRCAESLARAAAVGEATLLVPFVVTGVRAYQSAGRPADAERWLSDVAEHLVRVESVSAAALNHGRGLVALVSGSTTIAREALEAAVAGWDERGRTWEASWARMDLAGALARANRFAAAMAFAGQVRETAATLSSSVLRDRAEEIMRHGRGRIVDVQPWHPLTAREFEVARLISEGGTNAEIAHELSISPKTASAHVEHILAKLGVSRRTEIAAWAIRVAETTGSAGVAPVT